MISKHAKFCRRNTVSARLHGTMCNSRLGERNATKYWASLLAHYSYSPNAPAIKIIAAVGVQ
jgi:hypothetical protein